MPFQPGNKYGRGRPPAGKSLSDALRVALHERLPDGRTNYRAIADALVAKAREGDIGAIREVLYRTEGKVKLPKEEGASEPIVINFDRLLVGVL
jgi:hypothetical protein